MMILWLIARCMQSVLQLPSSPTIQPMRLPQHSPAPPLTRGRQLHVEGRRLVIPRGQVGQGGAAHVALGVGQCPVAEGVAQQGGAQVDAQVVRGTRDVELRHWVGG